jgi:hypothetical protein
MMYFAKWALVIVTVLVLGCKHHTVREDRPAVIINPAEQGRAELSQAVSEMLHGIPVILAGDALTQSDQLIVERAQHRDASGNLVMGYQIEKPREFRLIKNGDKCILIKMNSNERKQLKQVQCKAVK